MSMKDHHYRFFVIRVSSNDYDDTASHVAVELRPSAILRLAATNLVAQLIRSFLRWMCIYHIEIAFQEMDWLDWQPPKDDPDADYPEEWEQGAIVEAGAIRPEWLANEKLQGNSAQVTGDGGLWFACSHKHSSTEMTSWEVELSTLLKAIRREDVVAELQERFAQSRLGRIFAGPPAPEE
jgi:hypothetical protein